MLPVCDRPDLKLKRHTLCVRDAQRLAARVRSAPRWTVRNALWVGLQSDWGVLPSIGVFVGLKPDPQWGGVSG